MSNPFVENLKDMNNYQGSTNQEPETKKTLVEEKDMITTANVVDGAIRRLGQLMQFIDNKEIKSNEQIMHEIQQIINELRNIKRNHG